MPAGCQTPFTKNDRIFGSVQIIFGGQAGDHVRKLLGVFDHPDCAL